MKKTVGIIGAGPGGLMAGMLLSAKGYDVTIYEKDPHIGGRCGMLEKGDYNWDIGPTFLIYKELLEECFQQAGRDIHQLLDMVEVDPMYKLFFSDKTLSIFSDPEKMSQELEKVFPGSSPFYKNFCEQERKKFSKLRPVLQQDFSKAKNYFSADLIKALPHLGIGTSFFKYLKSTFQTDDLSLAFSFQSKYLGMSAWDCPSMFSIIPHLEHEYGIHHVMGGLNKINQAMAEVATANGTKIITSCPVRNILVKDKKAYGVSLDDGYEKTFDHMILNADFAFSMKHLIDQKFLKTYKQKKIENMKYSCSTFMLYLGLDKTFDLPFHSIYFADDYKKNVEEVFKSGHVSEDPSFYIRNSSIIDPSCAPEGHSALYVLIPVPNLQILQNYDWERYRHNIIKRLEKRIPNLSSHIKEEVVYTPHDWQEQMNIQYGATFNLAHNWGQLAMFRPHNAFNDLESLYLVGGGTHPGSGLPTIYESGRIATRLIMETEGRSYE